MNTENSGGRTPDQLREQFETERRLASKLKAATREERKTLYSSVYDELFQSIPHHPQLTRKENAARELRDGLVRGLVDLVSRVLDQGATFLEIGAGDCAVSLAVTSKCRKVFALDVSAQISRNDAPPANFELILSDGLSIPVAAGTVNVAFSHQLLEHLHPDDALEQLINVRAAIAPKGFYMCITPSSLSGPHDISKYFQDQPGGFHLKEYSTSELIRLFKSAGFSRFQVFFWSKGVLLRLPAGPVAMLEGLLKLAPRSWQRRLSNAYPLNRLLGNFIALK